jgi:hypothetical protein
MKQQSMTQLLRCAFALALMFTVVPALAQDKKPNILFILTDNLGYGDIGAFGGGAVRGAPTPRIDQLAREGLILTNFNVEPECTPSRSALMTGRMPMRSGTSKVAIGGLPEGIAPWEYTLAQLPARRGLLERRLREVASRRPSGAFSLRPGLRRMVGFSA